MDGTRSALIIASDDYTDPGLRRLRAPALLIAGTLDGRTPLSLASRRRHVSPG